MSAAETLRKAASLMRERATDARAGRWRAAESALVPDAQIVVADWENDTRRVATCSGSLFEGNVANAEHIASWHPAVALAVADWLDQQADWSASGNSIPAQRGMGYEPALAVATAYLGEQP